MNIYLIGYRCTGKTTVGRLLAEERGMAFHDMDARIAEQSGVSISEMVKAKGWDFFRRAEADLLKEISAGDNQVVSTGGGVVLLPENRERIGRSGVAVWLTAKPATIMGRMLADSRSRENRPPLIDGGMEKEIRDTLARRLPLYAQVSDFAVATDHFGASDVCLAVTAWLSERHRLRP